MTHIQWSRSGDGCRIAYRFDGPADAPVIVLSNSLGTHMNMWEPQMAALTSKYRVLRYDSRGHGSSDAPRGAYGMDRLGQDVIELLDALSIARVSFCGLSMGGMVGQWLGHRAPERIDRLILCNTSAYMGPPSGWDDRIATVHRAGMSALADAVIERWFTAQFRESGSPQVALVREMLLGTNPEGYAGCCAAIRDMDQRSVVGLIDRRTLIIAGEQDPATPIDHAQFLARRIQGAAMAVLPAAHLSNMERPMEFIQHVMQFLNRGYFINSALSF